MYIILPGLENNTNIRKTEKCKIRFYRNNLVTVPLYQIMND